MRYMECGCCGCFHREGYVGDCRNDDERHSADDIEFFSTTDVFEVVYLDEEKSPYLDLEFEDKFMKLHKPDKKLIATYFNFSPVTGVSVWERESGELLAPFFSKFACHTCGSKLAGDRYYCTATIGKKHTNPREKLEICVDCYEYFFT